MMQLSLVKSGADVYTARKTKDHTVFIFYFEKMLGFFVFAMMLCAFALGYTDGTMQMTCLRTAPSARKRSVVRNFDRKQMFGSHGLHFSELFDKAFISL